MNQTDPIKTQRPRRSRIARVGRWLFLALALACLSAGLTFWLVTRSWFLVRQVTPELERRLGGQVTIAHASYQGGGRIEVDDIRLRARGIDGPAAEVLSIRKAKVTIDLRALFAGRVNALNIELDEPLLRMSEDAHQSGRMNFMALEPTWSTSDKANARPPEVSVRNATIEVGTDDGGRFELLGKRMVSGEMHPTAGSSGWYNFELGEIDARGASLASNGVFIKGQWNFATNEHHSRIDGLELDDRIYRLCPQQVRLWWDRMQLQGKVEGMTVNWQKDRPFTVEFAVQNVSLTVPIREMGELWTRYHQGQIEPAAGQPRLHVRSGTIRLGTDALVLDKLTGDLGSSEGDPDVAKVPFALSLRIFDLPEADWSTRQEWMDRVLTTCPFEMKFRMDDFSLQRDASGAVPPVELPKVVARALQKFQMADWVLSTSVDLTRDPPTRGPSGEWIAAKTRTDGQAYLHKASGRYEKFPYQLDDVDAYLQFDNEKVSLRYLTGRGSDGATIRITGEVAPPDNDARVSLQLVAKNVPLDDRLRAALKEAELRAFDSMFHRPSRDSLAAAGLLPDQAAIDAAKAERDAAAARLAEMRSGPAASAEASDEIAKLQRRVEQLQRTIDAGPFELGGLIDLDLRIERPVGVHQPTVTTGAIVIQHAGLLYERFPYPLRFAGGTLRWEPDGVRIDASPDGAGLAFVTPGGGVGMATGGIDLPMRDGKRRFEPRLAIAIAGDAINESLKAAIPPAAEDLAPGEAKQWRPGIERSKAARMLSGLGMSGDLDASGTIGMADDQRVGFTFDVSMKDGLVRPGPDLATEIQARGELWPHDLLLKRVHADLAVSRDAAVIRSLAGRSDEGIRFDAQGAIGFDAAGTATDLTIAIGDCPIGEFACNLAPDAQAGAVNDLWSRMQPQGRFDVVYHRTGMGAEARQELLATPSELTLSLGGERVKLDRRAGAVRMSEGGLEFRHLLVAVTDGDSQANGTVELNGTARLGADAAIDLEGAWAQGRFESPLIVGALQECGLAEEADRCQSLVPAGAFDAAFRLQQPAGGALAYEVNVVPHTLTLKMNDTPVIATFTEGHATLRNNQVLLQGIRGRHGGGEFAVEGALATGSVQSVDLVLEYSGLLRSPELLAFLPRPAAKAIEDIQFDDGVRTTLKEGRLTMSRPATPAGSPWRMEFNGLVSTEGAAFSAGVNLSDVTGDFAFDIAYDQDEPKRFTIQADVDRAVAMGVALTDLTTSISLEESGGLIRVRDLRASSEEGVLTADAEAGIGDRREYSIDLALAGVPLKGLLKEAMSDPAAIPARSDVPPAAGGDRREAAGELFASFSMSGRRGEPATRAGRGVVRVLHGKMATIPLGLQVVQMLQFTLPFSGDLDYADADMYIEGDRIHFERILLESTVGSNAALQLFGEGEMNFETLELDTWFRSRSGVAIIRDVVGDIADRLYVIHVTGPLRNPQARIAPLPAPK